MLALSIFTHISVHIFICQQKVIMKGKNLLTAIGERNMNFQNAIKVTNLIIWLPCIQRQLLIMLEYCTYFNAYL